MLGLQDHRQARGKAKKVNGKLKVIGNQKVNGKQVNGFPFVRAFVNEFSYSRFIGFHYENLKRIYRDDDKGSYNYRDTSWQLD